MSVKYRGALPPEANRCYAMRGKRFAPIYVTERLRMSVPSDAERLVRQKIKELTPYHPVEAPEHLAARLGMPLDNIVKLDQNENPYGCSLLVQEALAAFDRYHHYPDADAQRVRQRLGIYCDTNPDRIIVGAGSDELIDA